MKIALPSRNNQIDSHFGHCEYFTVYTVNDSNEIISEEQVTSPAGCGCKSNIAITLSQMGVGLMLAGNMGEGAVRVLNNANIEVLRGCAGDIRAVAESYLSGTLSDNGESCHAHDHNCNHG